MIEVILKLVANTKKTVFLHTANVEEIHSFILNDYKWNRDKYYLRSNGHQVLHPTDINGSVEVVPRLCGGKGGFGSMLRAIGAQIEKTTNREACRDLSGRRLRDINEEQRLKKWISQQAEREREIEEKRKKKLEKLTSQPKHEFKDEKYYEERSEMTEKLNDAFEQGLVASSSTGKRKTEEEIKPIKKKKKLILDFDEFSSSDDSGENNESDGNEVVDEIENHPKTMPADVALSYKTESEYKDAQNTAPTSSGISDEIQSENKHPQTLANSEESDEVQKESKDSQKSTSSKTEESKSSEKIETRNS